MAPPKYKDQVKKVDDLLDKAFVVNDTQFEYKREGHMEKYSTEFEGKMTNDPVTGTASGSATYKVKPESGCWEGEIGVKSDGARDLKVTAKKLVDNTKMKFGCTYNPFADICNISTEVDFAVDKVHTTVTGTYGRKTGMDLTAVAAPCDHVSLGVSAFYNLKSNAFSTYNALAQFATGESKFSVEHQSIPGKDYSWGNWVARAHFKSGDSSRIAGRAIFFQDSKTSLFEIGGKYKSANSLTWLWKVNSNGMLSLGAKTIPYQDSDRKLVGRVGMQLNATKRNIFEEEGSWGATLKFVHKGY